MPPPEIASTAGAGVSLAAYTQPELIVPELRERDTAGIISELSHLLQRRGCVPDVLPFYHAALNRELLSNSAISCGIAFPHGRLAGVKQLQFAFGRARAPVIWGPKNSWPVQLVFLLAVPATDAASYLQVLSSLAKLGQEHDALAALRTASTAESVMAVFDSVKLRAG